MRFIKNSKELLAGFIVTIASFSLFHSFNATANHSYANQDSVYAAPEIIGASQWFNSEPLVIKDLKGKVVLVEFWTYGCINCIRTLPHINKLYDKYKDQGLVIIGVHSPEFFFEKIPSNVEKHIKKRKIEFPVVMDNDMKTWDNYNNRYWPAQYLIDKRGNVVYHHFGEGAYDVMDKNVGILLSR